MSRSVDDPRKLCVAHVVLQLAVGGMEKLLVEFARHADRARYRLLFVCLGPRGTLADDLEACGWPVECLGEAPGLRPGLVPRLARVFRRHGAAVVHTHNNNPLIYGGPAARLAGVPVVVQTRHGQTVGVSRRHQGLFRLAAQLADRIVCVSQDARRLSLAEGIPSRKTRVVWNGIDTARFGYRGPQPGGPAVMVGRMVPLKGVDVLLHATALAARACPDFRVEVAGDGEALPGLRELADRLGLSERVKFLGEVRDVPALLGRAGLFVLPSHSEGISLTLLEAMARGLPVTATRVGGNAEVVADGTTGLLVPPGDPARLADALLTLWRDPALARRLGEAGRARAEGHFDVRRMVAEYEAMYWRLIGRPARVARSTFPPEPAVSARTSYKALTDAAGSDGSW
jgi:glycosyltransferase involved in cell wall biosynthesis